MPIQIIGTSHIAKESTSFITKKILLEKPEIVAVELDISRFHSIFHPPRKLRFAEIPKIGFMGWLFAVIGSWLQRKFGESVGMVPGADMRAAIVAAKKIHAKIALIDRPIQITLKRLSTEMNFFTKLKFFSYLLFGGFFQSDAQFDLEKVPDEKLIKKLTSELKNKFPALYKVLVSERDEFIANQIILLKKENPDKNIIVVLGAGHVSGVKALLRTK
jgi:pheromone shutdown-related protein TraB